jgi:hypothetical protein
MGKRMHLERTETATAFQVVAASLLQLPNAPAAPVACHSNQAFARRPATQRTPTMESISQRGEKRLTGAMRGTKERTVQEGRAEESSPPMETQRKGSWEG